jgi:hypothetical protein
MPRVYRIGEVWNLLVQVTESFALEAVKIDSERVKLKNLYY